MTRRLGVLVALVALAATASAEKAKPKAPPAKEKKAPVAVEPPADGSAGDGSAADGSADPLANVPHILGPKLVDLGHNNEVDLPAGMILLEHDVAKQVVEKDGGNGDSIAALIIPEDQNQSWFVQVDYADEGYVDDSDANDLDAAALLKSYQQGTAEQNQRRKTLGVPELFVDGWSEKPHYEKAAHHLIWGLNAHDTNGPVINYFTRVLGRNGFMSVNLVDAPDKIEKSKVAAGAVLAGTRFKTGSLYEDHKSGDKSSGMGLKALILGGAGVAVFSAAKSGGFIGLLLVLKKGIIVLVAAFAAFFKKIFGRGKSVQLPPDGPPSDSPPVG